MIWCQRCVVRGEKVNKLDEEPLAPAPGGWVSLAIFFYLAMLVVAVLWRVFGHGESPLFAGAVQPLDSIIWWEELGFGLLIALAVFLLGELITRLPGGRDLAVSLAQSLGPLRPQECWLLALASGIAEEAFFRGALQPSVGWVAASLLFGLAHFVPRYPFWIWTLFAVLVGFLFGAVFEWRGTLFAPMIAHVLVNAVNLQRMQRFVEVDQS